MLKEFIERDVVDSAIKAAADHRKAIGVPGEQAGFLQAHDIVRSIPAADVVEVKHGRWHDVYMSSASSFVGTCSICGISNDIPPVSLAKYCPNCGAKMDGAINNG